MMVNPIILKIQPNSKPYLENANDDSKQSDSATENFNDEDFYKECPILSISESSARADDADTDSTEQVAQANSQTRSKHHVTCVDLMVTLRKIYYISYLDI